MSMPQDDFDDEHDDTPPEPQTKPREFRAQIEALNAENATLKAQAERAAVLEKENALYKANLGNLNEDQQAALLATATEITADALRDQAQRLGFVPQPEPTVPAGDLGAFDRVNEVTAGGSSPDDAAYAAELKATRNESEALAVMAKYNRAVVYGNDG